MEVLKKERKTNRRKVFLFLDNLEGEKRKRSLIPLAKCLMYKILDLDKTGVSGGDFFNRICEISGGCWEPSNDIVYKNLHNMEIEGLVRSHWTESEDKNKRNKRYYYITDEGYKELFVLKNKYMSLLKASEKIMDISVDYLFPNNKPIRNEEVLIDEPLSATLFSEINVLQLLCRRKEYIYGNKIKENLEKKYQTFWTPSYGTMYPILSALSVNKLVIDRWSHTDASSKLRTCREYKINIKGKSRLNYLKEQTNIYEQLMHTKTMYARFCYFIDAGKIQKDNNFSEN